MSSQTDVVVASDAAPIAEFTSQVVYLNDEDIAVIKKDSFNKVKFDTNRKKYGHDDTQLSYELSLLKSKVNHIENPIEHGDIDTNLVYLNKTKESLENLISLYEEEKIDIEFVRLIQLYHFLKHCQQH